MAQPLATGRIVWAEIADANGNRKLRPAIIVTPSDRLSSTATLEVVATTSRLPQPLPDDHVLLPWHPRGHPRTRLNRRCAAVCTWVARIMSSDIRDSAGIVPGPLMATSLTKISSALLPPDPPDKASDKPPGESSASTPPGS